MDEEPKLPRKLKKGYKYVFRTKHQLLDRLELVSGTMAKYKAEGKSDSWLRTLQMEVDYIQEELKRPYRVTKLTRKAEHLPGPSRYMKWRKENKNPTKP